MSSLAATQADGYYVPVEYYESGAYKKKSKSQWWASQAGGKSKSSPTKGDDDDGEVVRFELPYDGICDRCQSYVKRGTRFNATKSKVGDYYTTPIYEFTMRCRACPTIDVAATGEADESILRRRPQEFVIRVNPSEFGFDYLSGIRKLQRDFVADPADHCVSVEDRPLNQVEVLERQQHYAQHRMPSDLELLQKLQEKQSRSFLDADGNAALRAAFRPDRKRKKRQLAGGSALGWRSGLELLEGSTVQEECDAKTTVYGDCRSRDRDKWKAVRGESIFARRDPSKTRRRRQRTHPTEAEPIPDAVPSAARTIRRGSRNRTVEVVDLTERVDSGSQALSLRESDAVVKKRRTLTVLPTRTVLTAPVPISQPSDFPVANSCVTAKLSSMTSLLAGYDSSSSDK